MKKWRNCSVQRLTLQQTQVIAVLASELYSFLPGSTFAPKGIKIDFGTVAQSVGVGHLWLGGSKQPAIEALFEGVLQTKRDRFCPLMIKIVAEGIKYRKRKKKPVTQENIKRLNDLIAKLGFKIPELHDPKFIGSLPSDKINESKNKEETKEKSVNVENLIHIKDEFIMVTNLPPTERGYTFEKFLHNLFSVYNFNPRPAFRIQGEQIDGSIEFEHEIYLLEARWQDKPVTQADIAVLDSRVQGHSAIGRGIFITAGIFSADGIVAHQKLRPSSIFGVDGQDMYFILDHALPIDEVLRMKIRRLVETGDFHYPVAKFVTQLKTKLNERKLGTGNGDYP